MSAHDDGGDVPDSITPKRSGTCEERRAYWREQRKRWRANNRERARAANRQWRLNNIEKARAQSRAACKRYLAKPEKREALRQYFQKYSQMNRDRIREYQRLWVADNREKANAYVRAYDRKHREERRIAQQQRRAADLERVHLIEKKWRDRNREALKKKEHERRTALGIYNAAKVTMRVEFFGGVCAYCGGPFEHLDHAIAIIKGGSNWPANFRPACAKCNIRKGAKDWRQWPVRI